MLDMDLLAQLARALGVLLVKLGIGALLAALTLATLYAWFFIVRPNPVRAYQGVAQEEEAAVPT